MPGIQKAMKVYLNDSAMYPYFNSSDIKKKRIQTKSHIYI